MSLTRLKGSSGDSPLVSPFFGEGGVSALAPAMHPISIRPAGLRWRYISMKQKIEAPSDGPRTERTRSRGLKNIAQKSKWRWHEKSRIYKRRSQGLF